MSEIPERIGHYRVESSLGRGGMGEVFLAWDERLRRRVAVKRLRPDVADSPTSRERFRREASTAAELSHPGTVHVYDLVEEADGDYLVMEYVPGDSLARRLASGPLSVEETLRFGRQIAEGLAAAHAAGLVHRDLKADNVILTDKGEAKILDFGLARHVCPLPDETALTQRGFVVGTYHAMSPEQATGGQVDERSDLFSLGALFSEMLTGRSPFKGDTPAATLKRVLTLDPPPVATLRSDVPAALSTLISRLLAKDPADRPGSADLVARTLHDIAVNHHGDSAALAPTISELPTSWEHPGTVKPKLRRRWWVYGAVGAAAALAAVVLTIVLWPRPPLRVLVAPPEMTPAGGRSLELFEAAVLSAARDELSLLQGIEALDPSFFLSAEALEKQNPLAMAREAAADEVLVTEINAEGPGAAYLSVRRVEADGVAVPGEPGRRPVSLSEGELLKLGEAVRAQIRQAYAPRRKTGEDTAVTAEPEDYRRFVEVRARVDAGTASDPRSQLRVLEQVLAGSSNFLEARLLAARFYIGLFGSSGEPADRVAAQRQLAEARGLAPNDPRVLEAELMLALADSNGLEALRLLRKLAALRPGHASLLGLEASLAELEGRIDEALELRREEIRRAPSWRAYYNFAILAMQSGRAAEARWALDETERRWPDNVWPLRTRYEVELLYGDPQNAEQVARKLLGLAASAGHYTHLGLALFLQSDFEAAFDAYQRAFDLEPDSSEILLNLADVEFELGLSRDATLHWQQVVTRLGEKAAAGPTEQFALAQCLARLGQYDRALDVSEEALRKSNDPFANYTASLVNALAEQPISARRYAMKALKAGMAEHWFKIPAMKPVWDDPAFQAALHERQKPP